ncbi:MAG: phosphate/phosphite/phosphonate ABC transporter substrate-binding protein [Rhodocyclaceae bacterium]|nr:phosphate/phosphite/phosphonate ABC transporter substrate-binding protein [Rhodocyclaceae bacterium]
MVKRILSVLLLGVAFWGTAGFAAEAGPPLAFGVLNQQSPAKTAQRWNPILKYLSDVTGLRFQLRMGATVQETDGMMGRGEFDLVFTNHNFRKEYDGIYRVLARWAGKPIYGVVAVMADSPARSLRDMKGKRVAFPSREAFVAYAVPMAELRQLRIDVQPVFAGNQEGALAQLQAHQVDAVAVNSRFLTQYAASRNLRYREIFVSAAFADLPVVIHPRVPKEQAEAIRRALLAMKDDPRASVVLEAADAPGFESATEADYDNVRRIYGKGG